MNKDFVVKFWDRKILKWEALRYGDSSEALGRKHNSVAARLRRAINFIGQMPRTTRILDLGCGSGLLLEHLQAMGFTHLTGIDISSRALDHAKSRRLKAEIIVGDVLNTPWPDADLIVALGLSDWVHPKLLAERIQMDFEGRILISFSERKPSFKRWLHRVYVWMSYGWRTRGYVPCYYTAEEMIDFFGAHSPGLRVERFAELEFGAFLTNLKVVKDA